MQCHYCIQVFSLWGVGVMLWSMEFGSQLACLDDGGMAGSLGINSNACPWTLYFHKNSVFVFYFFFFLSALTLSRKGHKWIGKTIRLKGRDWIRSWIINIDGSRLLGHHHSVEMVLNIREREREKVEGNCYIATRHVMGLPCVSYRLTWRWVLRGLQLNMRKHYVARVVVSCGPLGFECDVSVSLSFSQWLKSMLWAVLGIG